MGVGGFKVANYSLWGQNDIVLAFLEPKRHRFSHHNFFFKILHIYQNNVVLNYEGPKQHRFELVVTYPKDVIWVSDNL